MINFYFAGQGRNTLIIAVTVAIVIIGLITLLSIIIFIVTCHRNKGKYYN